MQSTGQTSTHARSLTLMQVSVITYVIRYSVRFWPICRPEYAPPAADARGRLLEILRQKLDAAIPSQLGALGVEHCRSRVVEKRVIRRIRMDFEAPARCRDGTGERLGFVQRNRVVPFREMTEDRHLHLGRIDRDFGVNPIEVDDGSDPVRIRHTRIQ